MRVNVPVVLVVITRNRDELICVSNDKEDMMSDIIISNQKRNNNLDCISLWRDCFGDSERYMEYYFTHKTKDNLIYRLFADNKMVSMLHMNPYEHSYFDEIKTLHYIVGVATDENYRKRGYMRKLLEVALREAYERREPLAYLMPAAPTIYEPHGFRYIYRQRRIRFLPLLKKVREESEFIMLPLLDWSQLSIEEKNKVCKHVNMKLKKEFNFYAIRDISYYDRLREEMTAAGGELLVYRNEKEYVGLISYMKEENQVEVTEIIVDSDDTDHLLGSFTNKLLQLFEGQQGSVTFLESHYWNENILLKWGDIIDVYWKPIIMARIVHLQEFFKNMRAEQRIDRIIQISDPILPQNNGTYRIVVDKTHAEMIRSNLDAEITMDIADFVIYCLGDIQKEESSDFLSYYSFLNEIV